MRYIFNRTNRPKEISVFSKFLLHGYGGAEKSTAALVARFIKEYQIKFSLIGTDGLLRAGSAKSASDFSLGAETLTIQLPYKFPMSPLWEYYLNRTFLKRFGVSLRSETLWTYGILGPGVARGFTGSLVYFVRSETDLGIFDNYHSGFFSFLYRIKKCFETIPRRLLNRDIAIIMSQAVVVANSEYMSNLAKSLFDCDPIVLTPDVNVDEIRFATSFVNGSHNKIVLAGDGRIKGEYIFLSLASRFPDEFFVIYTRKVSMATVVGNIEYRPWTASRSEVFADAKLILVPSQWREAYGRVAREAYLLGIPVLVSKLGGLPEAVEHDRALLVEDYMEPSEWYHRVKASLTLINGSQASVCDKS